MKAKPIPMVGGKQDGRVYWTRQLHLEATFLGEKYVLVESKEEGGKIVPFYMLAGMTPVEAIKTLRERNLC